MIGIMFGIYEDNRFKLEIKKLFFKLLDIIGFGIGSDFEKKFKYVVDVCFGVIFGREFVNVFVNVFIFGS